MFGRDRASQALGMALEEVQPELRAGADDRRADMLNGHGSCHGGLVFALADSAFAFACSARAASAPWPPGARSVPCAGGRETCSWPRRRSARWGRTGVYDADVRREGGGW